jgi:hypothetical protein
MILGVCIVAFFALAIDETSQILDEKDDLKVDEILDSVAKQLKALELRMSNNEELIKDLKIHIEHLQIAEPRLGVLGLMKNDDALGEIVSKTYAHHFIHVAALSLRVPQRDRVNLPKNKLPDFETSTRRSSVQVIITVSSNQQIQLWDAELNELAAIAGGLSSPITAIKATSSDERGHLLVGGADGNARVFSVSAWRIYEKETHTQTIAGYITELGSSRLSPWKSGEKLDTNDEWPAAIQAIGWSSNRNTKEILVGYSNGWIRLYKQDGTFKNEIYSGNNSISAIGYKTDRTLKPIFTTKGFRFCKINNFKLVGGFCAHKEGTQFTGHAFDLVKTYYLYVGYSDGRIILFDTKSLAWKRLCKPKFEIEVEAGSPLQLEITEGFLLASSPTTLYVFNTTGVSITEPPALVEQRVISEEGNGVFGALTSTLDVYHHTLVVATQLQSPETCDQASNGGSRMVVYESYTNRKEKKNTYNTD